MNIKNAFKPSLLLALLGAVSIPAMPTDSMAITAPSFGIQTEVYLFNLHTVTANLNGNTLSISGYHTYSNSCAASGAQLSSTLGLLQKNDYAANHVDLEVVSIPIPNSMPMFCTADYNPVTDFVPIAEIYYVPGMTLSVNGEPINF